MITVRAMQTLPVRRPKKQSSSARETRWWKLAVLLLGLVSVLLSPEKVADKRWVMLDHVQTWTANLGIDLHDTPASTHVSVVLNYGSGMRTGADSDKTVPSHVIVDLTIRHRFDIFSHLRPEIAVDVLNLFNEVYAYRIGTGYVGSAYGPLRRVFVRLSVPFS
jgi:hypothetical protein